MHGTGISLCQLRARFGNSSMKQPLLFMISMPLSPLYAAAFEGCAPQALACSCSSQLLSFFLQAFLLSTCLLPVCDCMVCLHRIVGSWCKCHTCRPLLALLRCCPDWLLCRTDDCSNGKRLSKLSDDHQRSREEAYRPCKGLHMSSTRRSALVHGIRGCAKVVIATAALLCKVVTFKICYAPGSRQISAHPCIPSSTRPSTSQLLSWACSTAVPVVAWRDNLAKTNNKTLLSGM